MSQHQLHKVVPLDHFNLILEFENGQLRKFPKERVGGTDMWFLAFPMKLRSYLQKDGGLVWESIDKTQMWGGQNVWEQKLSLSADQLFDVSEAVSLPQLESCLLTVGMENQAPTSEDEKHHVYCVSIRPFSCHKWLIFSESIGGGHGERGGSVSLSTLELSSFKTLAGALCVSGV
ncbi:hypothetical protein BTA51_01115 [Hahella sp. CCB-MM4]|uniref:hypothetical protein n=1 Tax=Hahella sp. (strain CCB-MM4) TaxID=1926491 RepID=UPI000B9ABFE1|nr:hypothetical protein [Hahella sp. CCB-MM4]OZG75032.1 hypothetical protein BTA51_01115 [Hahella sp. CCB-MM4]